MKDISFIKRNVIAHRGYYNNEGGIPENSIKAFKKALENNYIIEFDIHLLKDNTIVVFHDNNIKRLTGINKKIIKLNYNEIKKLNLLNTNEKIPTFQEVLNLIDGKVPILIEFKSDTHLGKLEKEAMKILKNYKGLYAVQSFHPGSVFYFRTHYPNIIRGQLSYDYKDTKIGPISRYVMRNMLFNFLTKPDFISFGLSNFKENNLLKWKKKRTVLGWTIKSLEDYKKYGQIFDNIICENMYDYIEIQK